MKNRYLIITSACAAFLLIQSTAQAQNTEPMQDNTEAGTGYFGVTGLVASEYLGSGESEILALPYLSLNDVKGFDFFGTALTYRAIDAGTGQGLGKWSLRAGPRIAYVPGRDSDESPNLEGFEDVDFSIPLGGYVFSTIGPVGLRLDAGQDVIGGHGGFTADASVGTSYTRGKFNIQPSATVSWADNDFNDSFFSVTSEQSASSGLDTFNSGSGIYSYSVNAVATYYVTKKYAIVAGGSYRWFTEDALDSPILNANDGSDNGFFLSLSVARKFDTKKWFK